MLYIPPLKIVNVTTVVRPWLIKLGVYSIEVTLYRHVNYFVILDVIRKHSTLKHISTDWDVCK